MWSGTENQVMIHWIRHGQTASNKEHRYLGLTDERLSVEGKMCLCQNAYPEVELLFSGAMKRCTETANIIYPNQEVYVIPSWTEMDFGRFEGKNYQDLNGDPDYQAWIDSGGTLPFPEGECRTDFIKRSCEGFEQLKEYVQRYAKEHKRYPKNIGCVVNGGTIMAVLSSVLGGDYFDYQVKNGEVFCCLFDTKQMDIVAVLNEV